MNKNGCGIIDNSKVKGGGKNADTQINSLCVKEPVRRTQQPNRLSNLKRGPNVTGHIQSSDTTASVMDRFRLLN